MVGVLNNVLRMKKNITSRTEINNANELLYWFLSINALLDKPAMWCVLFGIFDNKTEICQFLDRLKQNLSIDFKNFKKYFFLETLFNYSLYQIRKLFSKEMNTLII